MGKYTEEEVKKIRDFYEIYDVDRSAEFNVATFAKSLNRSRGAIYQKARVLGLLGKGIDHNIKINQRTILYKVKNNECWITTQDSKAKKSWQINEWVNGKHGIAIRRFYEEKYGEIPEGMCLVSSCRSKVCLNPDHAKLISRHDINLKLRQTKLTDKKVKNIRSLRNKGWKISRIAEKYDIHESLVSRIANGTRWVN